MSSENINQDAQTVNPGEQSAQSEQSVQTGNDTNWKSLHENEVSYNKKLRSKNQELESRLEAIEKDKAAARQKKMEEAGEYQSIIKERDTQIDNLKGQVGEYKAYFDNRKNKILETFSDEDRESFGHLPLNEIEKLSKRLNAQSTKVPNVPEGRDAKLSEFGGYSSYQEWATKDPEGYEKANSNTDKDKASALDDVDFELELMHRDVINVAYILNLLSLLVDAKGKSFESKKKQISDMLSGDINLRSKKELIEQFIEENLVDIENSEDVAEKFDSYWGEQKLKAFNDLCDEENLDKKQIEAIVEEHLFANQVPAIRDKVMDSMLKKESILTRPKTITRVISKIMSFVDTFIEGMAA